MQLQVFASSVPLTRHALAENFYAQLALAAPAGVGQGQGVIENQSQPNQAKRDQPSRDTATTRNGLRSSIPLNYITEDLLALLPALEAEGAPLANAYGREQPEIGPEFIGFNGAECCGHEKNPDVRLALPAKDAHDTADNMGKGGTVPIALVMAICSYESVCFERVATIEGEDGRVECAQNCSRPTIWP